jgi:hypothetical protein
MATPRSDLKSSRGPVDPHDYQPPPQRVEPARSQEPQLGIQTEAPTSAKPWMEAQDATYVGKVMVCEGPKYSGSTVMGAIEMHGLNAFSLCLDIGTAFTKVKVDNLYKPVRFSHQGNDHHVATLREWVESDGRLAQDEVDEY